MCGANPTGRAIGPGELRITTWPAHASRILSMPDMCSGRYPVNTSDVPLNQDIKSRRHLKGFRGIMLDAGGAGGAGGGAGAAGGGSG